MQALVVLGAALRPDGRPRPALARRIETAARRFAEGAAPLVLVTGGARPAGRMTEAAAMHAALVEQGVPPGAILVEDRARDTVDNARLSIPMLRAAGVERAWIVTDRVHMPRALAIFRLMGMPCRGAPCAGPAGWPGALYRARETAALPGAAARALAERFGR